MNTIIINTAWMLEAVIVGQELVTYNCPRCVIYATEAWSHCLSAASFVSWAWTTRWH